MPTDVSGMRIARSFVTPTESAVSRVIDFQLGAQEGIRIRKVFGDMQISGSNWTPSATALGSLQGVHTLHAESGSLETVPDTAGEDEDTIDSEIFYRQVYEVAGIDEPTAQGAASISVVPNGPWEYEGGLFLARNITHRGITSSASLDLSCHVTILYNFVKFSLSELGFILARRV